MGEYILRPRSHNYISSHEYDDANHKASLAYDNDEDTYWSITSSYGKRTFYNFDFSEIPNNANITSAAIQVICSKIGGATADVELYSVKRLVTSVSSSSDYIDKLPSLVGIGSKITKQSVLTDKTIQYIKDNLSSIKAGGTLGFFLSMYVFSGELRIYDISLHITTEESTKIFLGETPVTSAYIGNTKLAGILLGNTKLL